jgi:hypothetical protein
LKGMAETAESDQGKTHHVLYNKNSQMEMIAKAKALLESGFEAKTLGEDVVIFLTKQEADLLVSKELASLGDDN